MIFKNIFLAGVLVVVTECCCLMSAADLMATPTPPPQPPPPPQDPQPLVKCPMEWVSPTTFSDAGEMPPSGVLPLDWTDNPGASDYELTVVTPNGSPVSYDVDGSSKDLFLENFQQTGSYQIVVTALDADGNPLCSITMNFEMPVVTVRDPANPQAPEGNGDEGGNDGGGINIPIIVLPPAPTEDVPK